MRNVRSKASERLLIPALLRLGAVVLSLVMMMVDGAVAQTVERLTEQKSVRQGMEHNRQVQAARADAAEARAALGEAQSARLPSIDAQASYMRLSDVPEVTFDFPSIDSSFTLLPFERNQVHTEISVEQPLFAGFRISNSIRAARRQATAAEHQARQREADIALQIREAYWRLYEARSISDATSAAVATVNEYTRQVGNRVEAGAALRADLLSVQTRRSEIRLEQIDAANAVRLAELELNRLTGLPLDASIIQVDEPSEEALPSAVDLLEDVRAGNPTILALTAQVEALEAQLRATQGQWLPEVAAVGRYAYARPNPYFYLEQDEFKGSWEAGVALRWNLFDGGRRSAEASGARARLNRAQAELADVERQVELNLRRRYLEAERAREAADVAEVAVEEARESLRVVRRLYEEGAALTSQLLDAEQAYRQAETRRSRAVADRRIARAALLNALGRVW